MIKKNLLAAALFPLLLAFLFPVQLAPAQERETAIEKILNPLPEFDPFEPPPAPPLFFPDEVDKKTREVLIDALADRNEALQDHLRFFEKRDTALRKEQGTVTGLTEYVRDLANNAIQDRERYLAAQKSALKNASSPERKKYLEATLKHDDLSQAEQFLRQNSANRWGALLNRFLSSVDLITLVSGSYVGAAVDTAMSQMFEIGNKEMSIEERKALAHYFEHLKRYPYDPRNPEIWKQVDVLEKKKKSILVGKQLDTAEEAAEKGAIDKALFHYLVASILDPESPQVEKGLERAERLTREREAATAKALAATETRPLPADQEREVNSLLQALSLRDTAETERLAGEMERKYTGAPLAASARDAAAVALEMKGRHEQAKKIIEQIARSSNDAHAQKRAAALLESPEYNLLTSFREARSERRLATVKYVLLGEDLLRKNLVYGTGPLVAAGPAGAATLGAANVLMIGTNLFQVLTANPVSSEAVIDKGVAYVRNHPQSESATEVYNVLGAAYEERGMFDKAIDYYEMSGSAPKDKIAELKNKAAKNLLNAAAKNGARSAREYYLTRILDNYPESPAAAEATEKLAALAKVENQGMRMSKQFLMEHPELYGPQGLGLKASLFDRNPKNMELADRGVNLLSEREIVLYYQTPWGVRSQSYPLSKQAADRFFAALRRKNYEVAMADVDQRAKGSVGGIRNVPLPLLRGERERNVVEEGEESGDTTMSLVREAGGSLSTFPKVLDHELLSENERDPTTKYRLPPMHGSISASRFDLSGDIPAGLWGNRLSIGSDHRSPFAGVQVPIPLLQGFIPIDFMLQGRPGRFAVFPKIHTSEGKGQDQELYR